MNTILLIIVLAVFVEAVTYIALKAEPVQLLTLKLKSLHPLLDTFLSCGYCISFWVSFLTLSLYQICSSNPVLLFECRIGEVYINFFIVLLILHRSSNIIHGAIDKYFDKQYDRRYRSIFEDFE